MSKPKKRGPGRPRETPTKTHGIRCTDPGWKWLNDEAAKKGHKSVGKWADNAGKGRKKKDRTKE